MQLKILEKFMMKTDIYIFRHNPEGCIHGILTNRDDKPEKAVGWVILSGKENCKQQQAYSLF